MGDNKKYKQNASEISILNNTSEDCNDGRKLKRHEKRHRSEKSGSHKRSRSSVNDDGCSTSKEHRQKEKKNKKKSRKREKKHKVKAESEEVESADVPLELMQRTKVFAAMTKEEWDKRQSVVKRVFDADTGRHRLIKGDGEVLEEIVSKDRHKSINRQATRGDGEFFQSHISAVLKK